MKNLRYMVVFPLLLIMVSIVGGWRCYDRAKEDMVDDLNQALQRTALADASVNGLLDSLSAMNGNPILTFGGGHNGFSNLLRIPSLRDTAQVAYSLAYGSTEDGSAPLHRARVCSDTVMLAQRGVDGEDIVLAVKAYANPSMASMLRHGGMAWPMASFVVGIMLLAFMLVNSRLLSLREEKSVFHARPAQGIALNGMVPVGARLELTPMQERLMEMFLSSPARTLSKEEICSALWPKKDNPDDTLYTFISRLKASLARQSSLRIENRRGREYFLTDETGEKACCPTDERS